MSKNINDIAQHDDLLIRVGQVLRLLHGSVRRFGPDTLFERAAVDISYARYLPDYVANMSEQAAQWPLNAIDLRIPLQECFAVAAKALYSKLQSISSPFISLLKYQQSDAQASAYLGLINTNSLETKAHRLGITKAQDFQNFTGQLIRNVTELVQNFELQLLQLLIKYSPDSKKCKVMDGLFNEPQIGPEGRPMCCPAKSKLTACWAVSGFSH